MIYREEYNQPTSPRGSWLIVGTWLVLLRYRHKSLMILTIFASKSTLYWLSLKWKHKFSQGSSALHFCSQGCSGSQIPRFLGRRSNPNELECHTGCWTAFNGPAAQDIAPRLISTPTHPPVWVEEIGRLSRVEALSKHRKRSRASDTN